MSQRASGIIFAKSQAKISKIFNDVLEHLNSEYVPAYLAMHAIPKAGLRIGKKDLKHAEEGKSFEILSLNLSRWPLCKNAWPLFLQWRRLFMMNGFTTKLWKILNALNFSIHLIAKMSSYLIEVFKGARRLFLFHVPRSILRENSARRS